MPQNNSAADQMAVLNGMPNRDLIKPQMQGYQGQFPPSNPGMPQNTGIVPQGLNPQVTEQVFSQLQGGAPQGGLQRPIAPSNMGAPIEQPLNQPIAGQTQPLQGGVVKPGGIAQSPMQYNTLTGRR
jgi:hypothetical protein